ncbi:MAG: hypothetical protein DI570_19225 [Phenylobacterium zucineum]|nr:MAG: hypothetical protein DI570_19225 [Phenylobacterium zucineum]
MPTFVAGTPLSIEAGTGVTLQLALNSTVLTSVQPGSAGGPAVSTLADAGVVTPAAHFVTGAAGDDVIPLAGGIAFGGAGADSFLLTPISSRFEPLTDFGVILDFEAADKLDLSALGADAKILGSESILGGSAQRVSIDFDGDGKEDGFVVTHAPLALDGSAELVTPNAFAEGGAAVSALSSLLPAGAVPSAAGTFELREATAEDFIVVPTALSLSAEWIVA